MTAFLAVLVAVIFFCWLYLHESAKLDEREDRMSQHWVERWHREHR